MAPLDDIRLPPPQRLAVAWSPSAARPAMHALLAFDTLLAELVANTREPMLGQIRLAWWRDRLGEPPESRPAGNPQLEAIGAGWRGEEAALVALVDGWEQLLGEAPLADRALASFAEGRGEAFVGLARLCGVPRAATAAARHGRQWALADLHFRTRDEVERALCRSLYEEDRSTLASVPRELRGLAVLAALADRAMARDRPLMAGRGAALLAWRVGLLGR